MNYRRLTFGFVFILTLMFTRPALSHDSQLGIDYLKLSGGNEYVAQMFADGEKEWLKNANHPDDYGTDTVEVWRDVYIPELASGNTSEFTIDEMKRLCPCMVRAWALIPIKLKKYAGLQSIGTHHIASSFSGKLETDVGVCER